MGEWIGRMIGKPERFSFNPKNYYRLLLGALGKVSFHALMDNPHGLKVRDIQFGAALKRMATPSKRIDIAPQDFVEGLTRAAPPPKRWKRFPLILITGERSPHTKNTQLRGVKSLTRRQSGNSLRISSKDADSASIDDGDLVEVSSPRGSIVVPASVTSDIRPGVVSLTHGWGRRLFHPETHPTVEEQGCSANPLTDDEDLDPLSGMPVFDAIPCSVRRSRESDAT
jgi:anaerobic selenocysteine-containing dehydrogenase